MAHEVGEKREQEVRFVAQIAAQRPAHARFDRLEFGTQRQRRFLVHDADRREVALLAVARDLRLAQQSRHGVYSGGRRPLIARQRTRAASPNGL